MYSHPGNRPRSLKISDFRFPLNALLSGAHRVTGLALVLSLIAYLVLTNLILFTSLTLEQVSTCWLTYILHTGFWVALSYHWLSGLRHLLAEHFLQLETYQLINSKNVSVLLLATWLVSSVSIIYQVWF